MAGRWDTRTAKLRASREIRINNMVNNQNEQLYQMTVALHYRGMATIYFVMVVLFLVMGTMGFVVMSMELQMTINLHTPAKSLNIDKLYLRLGICLYLACC